MKSLPVALTIAGNIPGSRYQLNCACTAELLHKPTVPGFVLSLRILAWRYVIPPRTMIAQRDSFRYMDCQPVIMADRRVRAQSLIPVGGGFALLDGMDWYRLGDAIRSG